MFPPADLIGFSIVSDRKFARRVHGRRPYKERRTKIEGQPQGIVPTKRRKKRRLAPFSFNRLND